MCVISLANDGGAQNALLKIARLLRKRGHQVSVIFLYGNPAIFAEEPHCKVLLPGPAPGWMGYIRAFARLIRAVRGNRPSVMLGFLPLGNILGALAARLCGVRRVIVSHRSPVSTYGRIMRRFDRLAGTVGLFNQVICVSNAVADGLKNYPASYRQRIVVIHNGVEPMQRIGRSAARERFNLSPATFVYVALGRLSAQKNYPALIRWVILTTDGVLLIAGDGPDRDALNNLILGYGASDRVVLLGGLSKPDARALLEAADVFVQPSLFEGQSNAVLEAMSLGVPMVLSDIPEQRESVDEGNGGFASLLIALDDSEGWVRGLEDLRTNTASRLDLSDRALRLADRNYAIGTMIDRFEACCLADG